MIITRAGTVYSAASTYLARMSFHCFYEPGLSVGRIVSQHVGPTHPLVPGIPELSGTDVEADTKGERAKEDRAHVDRVPANDRVVEAVSQLRSGRIPSVSNMLA